ncbi:hypothetical protein M0638_19135 [Roseomonas sp. NAR14]|uniref:Anti-sigma factor NepR domain-containing protein n=1 Tax=Roseomonas acroporae TaxID=2937791 RepID=A0A9X2BY13_9PROT|nr:NepR family anti-sigma factor [Roseomonas acroporae]MCK8786494.1 hypothetical protein [Roseomonas acroporae]
MNDTDPKARGKGGRRKTPPQDVEPPEETEGVDAAFDIWLRKGLHQLYDDVAAEPVPDELLRLIEEDRNRRKS